MVTGILSNSGGTHGPQTITPEDGEELTIRNDRANQAPLQNSNAAKTISTNDALETHCDELAVSVRRLFGHATTAGFHFSHSVCFAAMFEPIRERIETAA